MIEQATFIYRNARTSPVVAGSRAVESGRMLIFFGGSGDLAYLQELIDEEGFQREVLAQHSLVRDGWQVGYFTFRLTGLPPILEPADGDTLRSRTSAPRRGSSYDAKAAPLPTTHRRSGFQLFG